MSEKLEQAIREVEAGNKEAAIALLAQVLKEDSTNEEAWIWMSEAVDDSIKKVECLEKVLEVNPFNQDALRGLEHLRGEAIFMRSDPFPFRADNDHDEAAAADPDPFQNTTYPSEWSVSPEAEEGELVSDESPAASGWEAEPPPLGPGGLPTPEELELSGETTDLEEPAVLPGPSIQPLPAAAPARARKSRTVFSKSQFLILGGMLLLLLLVVCGGGAYVIYNLLNAR